MQGTTSSGYQFDIDDKILSDWRFTMALAKCEKRKNAFESLQAMNEMAELLFGDQMEAFFEHIKEKNGGYVPFEVVMNEIKEIFESKVPKN